MDQEDCLLRGLRKFARLSLRGTAIRAIHQDIVNTYVGDTLVYSSKPNIQNLNNRIVDGYQGYVR